MEIIASIVVSFTLTVLYNQIGKKYVPERGWSIYKWIGLLLIPMLSFVTPLLVLGIYHIIQKIDSRCAMPDMAAMVVTWVIAIPATFLLHLIYIRHYYTT
jgi:hypothetical protein